MDLNTVLTVSSARSRDDLAALGPTVVPLAGGSDLFGEPQTHLTGLVDLQTLGWEPLTVTADGLDIAATCTIAELSRLPEAIGLAAHPLFFQCAAALYGSFKIWNVATVGGNLCASLPAGPMTALAGALDGEVLLWRADGSDERLRAVDFVTGNQANRLEPGDVLRSIFLPGSTLVSRTAFRRIALSPLGRSGTLLIGRADADGGFVLTVTAGTVHPVQLRYDSAPSASALARDIAAIDSWFTDAHGAADWRRAVSGVLGEEIRAELAQGQSNPGYSWEDARDEVRA
ncbi:CO/xanthine dehydrogenase FAD-binding subunit [Cryobacterium sp. MP_M5]|uniref:FAD binding domain-containing protein n=1 Tax=unclassified Cryobacterium TaxID=2649013 RepID=UPI0018C9CC64|nr:MULTISPECIES: FAD binding domain-containing protein [unclassified Cryobacterium]MBG6058471.1 CO/xanthine dehydrogenase FAD-binding subunit [Cryobacterium sp. MP_M3]MEC5176877.1 CO/xanthine dehydrogenase FAD-binding subunit [Cryobacterium sp. MP_M5]